MYVAVDWNGIAKDKFYKDEEAEVGYNQTLRYGCIMGNEPRHVISNHVAF